MITMFTALLLVWSAAAAPVIHVTPVTYQGVQEAMAAAEKADWDATLLFPAGAHNISLAGPLFNFARVAPPPGGRLVVAGAGMDVTTLVIDTVNATNDVLQAKPCGAACAWRQITVRDLTFARSAMTTTQGTVVSCSGDNENQTLVLQLDPSFPAMDELLKTRTGRISAEQGLFLRRYKRMPNGQGGPQLIVCSNTSAPGGWPPSCNMQVKFDCAGSGGDDCPAIQDLGGGRWRLQVHWDSCGGCDTKEVHRYRSSIGDGTTVVAVKVKHGGQAFAMFQGDDLAFERVRWTHHSRGIIQNTNNVRFLDTVVERYRADAAIGTPGGGPQVNGLPHGKHPVYGGVHNLSIVNHTAAGTGDDSLGLFGITSGEVRGCHIKDSFDRGILLDNVTDAFAAAVEGGGNVVERCPIYRTY